MNFEERKEIQGGGKIMNFEKEERRYREKEAEGGGGGLYM